MIVFVDINIKCRLLFNINGTFHIFVVKDWIFHEYRRL